MIRDVAYADWLCTVICKRLVWQMQKTLVSSSYKIYIDASLVTEQGDFAFVCIFVPLRIFNFLIMKLTFKFIS